MSGESGFATAFEPATSEDSDTAEDLEDMSSASGAKGSLGSSAGSGRSHVIVGASQSVSADVVRSVFSGKSAHGTEAVAGMWQRGEFDASYRLELKDAEARLRMGVDTTGTDLATQVLPTELLRGRSGTDQYGLQSIGVALIDNLLAATVRAAHSSE